MGPAGSQAQAQWSAAAVERTLQWSCSSHRPRVTDVSPSPGADHWPHPVSAHCPPYGQPHWWPLTGRCFDSGPLRNCVVGGRGISGSYLAHWLRRWLRVRESLCCQALAPARINNCITLTLTPLSLRAEASPDQSRPTNKKLLVISETMTLLEANFSPKNTKHNYYLLLFTSHKRLAAPRVCCHEYFKWKVGGGKINENVIF